MEGSTEVWLPLVHPYRGPGPKPGMCLRLGIRPATLWFSGLP